MFDTIKSPGMPLSLWATSLVVHGGTVALLVAIPWGVRQTLQVHQMDSGVRLVAPRLTPPPGAAGSCTYASARY
jgi:hypothetical protein